MGDITGGRGFGKIRFLGFVRVLRGFVRGAGDSRLVLWVLSYLAVFCVFSPFFAIFVPFFVEIFLING